MTRVLVTGASGQDGGYLVERLLGDGDEVHVLTRSGGAVAGVVAHAGDLRDDSAVRRAVEQADPDVVVNLAAVSSVAASWTDPVGVGEVNGLGVTRLLQAAAGRSGPDGRPIRFVQASSQEIFAGADRAPQAEHFPLTPTNPYGVAKAYAHRMVATYRSRGVDGTNLILYSHESPRRPATFAARRITRGAARIARGLDDVLELGNLDVRRDWGWAPDVVDAFVLAIRADEPGDYVIATGESHSVREFVAEAFAVAGVDDWEARVRVDARRLRPSDAADMRGDASRAAAALGWRPTMRFEGVVRTMVEHDLAEIDREEGRGR